MGKCFYFIIILFIFIISCGPEIIDKSELEKRDGLFYKKNSKKPFTGNYVEYYENKQKESEGSIKDGKEVGTHTRWYRHGTKWKAFIYKDSDQTKMKCIEWYKNGQKKYEGMYEKGRANGISTWWYQNGWKKSEGNYKNGIPVSDSFKAWDKNGRQKK